MKPWIRTLAAYALVAAAMLGAALLIVWLPP